MILGVWTGTQGNVHYPPLLLAYDWQAQVQQILAVFFNSIFSLIKSIESGNASNHATRNVLTRRVLKKQFKMIKTAQRQSRKHGPSTLIDSLIILIKRATLFLNYHDLIP